MLDQSQRTAILQLRREGVSIRKIGRLMKVSRGAVRRVLQANTAQVPTIDRPMKAEPHRSDIIALHKRCEGNLVRVHEELVESGIELSYQALTAFCRRLDIGREPPVAVGRYDFEPGEEMQHDTSPTTVEIGGRVHPTQIASQVTCYSRMQFFQLYPRYRRFECKLFLDEAVRYIGGACGRCMIDNTHVIVLKGTGKEMVPVPEMAAYGDRYGYAFAAHEINDPDRKPYVENSLGYIQKNFLAGRTFVDWDDANRQAREWCDKTNERYRKHLHASPRELHAMELPHLKPLPIWVPPVYLLHHRIVDQYGYVSVDTNRYSVPDALLGRRLEVRETANAIEIYDGARLIATHKRCIEPLGRRFTLPEHRRSRRRRKRRSPVFEETALLTKAPELREYVLELKRRSSGRGTLALRRLLRMVKDYPRQPLVLAVSTAFDYGLYDLDRLERMVLRNVARDFFDLEDEDAER